MFDSSQAPWGVERQGSGLQGRVAKEATARENASWSVKSVDEGAAHAGKVTRGGGSVPQINLNDDVPAAGKKTITRYQQDRPGQKGSVNSTAAGWGQPA